MGTKIPKEVDAAIIDDYYNSNLPVHQIAVKHGVSQRHIYDIVNADKTHHRKVVTEYKQREEYLAEIDFLQRKIKVLEATIEAIRKLV